MNIQVRRMKQQKKKAKTLSDVISPRSLNIIDIRDKEMMVYAMKKLIEDLDAVDLMFASMNTTPEQTLRLRQFVNNNKLRGRKVIWGLTVSRIKDMDEKEEYAKLKNQEEEYD